MRTPNLLGLARGGLHASQMIAAATTTTPCVASILTGAYEYQPPGFARCGATASGPGWQRFPPSYNAWAITPTLK